MFQELVKKNRSYRRFDELHRIDRMDLAGLVDLARCSPSASNMQPLKYIIVCEPLKNAAVFPLLKWAGYLKTWGGPKEGERPTAYIIILLDKSVKPEAGADHGIAAQTILLGAAEMGLGGCMIASVNRAELGKILAIPDGFDILLVVALGKPNEKVVLDEIGADGDIKYWRDANDVHHVPKRRLDDIILDL